MLAAMQAVILVVGFMAFWLYQIPIYLEMKRKVEPDRLWNCYLLGEKANILLVLPMVLMRSPEARTPYK